jgi:hypothetical protein
VHRSIGKACFTGSRVLFRPGELCEPTRYERVSCVQANLGRIDTHAPRPVSAAAITDPVWLGAQLSATARRYRLDRRPTIGVLWWYSASSVLLGPVVESLVRTGVALDPSLSCLTMVVEPDGRLLDARSGSVLDNDKLGPALAETVAAGVRAVSVASGAPGRALWAIATDSLANRVLWAGGTADVAVELAAAVGPELPAPRFVSVGGRLVVRRASCCLIYEAPGQAKCTSCPRQTPEERHRRLSSSV